MTISSTIRTAGPYAGTGIQQVFPFNFKVFANTDLLVLLASSGTFLVQALTTQYTVSLNADQNTAPGGTVTMLTAPPINSTLTLTSQVPELQPTDLANVGNFYPRAVTDALDRLTILAQQFETKILGSLRAPTGELINFLPPAGSRANSVLGFDVNGNPVATLPASGSGTALALDLANSSDPARGAALVARATPQIQTLAVLRTTAGRYDGDAAFMERVLAGYNAGGGTFVWNATDTRADNGVTIVAVGGVATGRWNRLYTSLTISMFGAKAVAGFDNATAFANCVAFLAAESAALRPVPEVGFEPGIYEQSVAPNLAVRGLRWMPLGQVIITNTGAGYAMVMDGGASATKVDGVMVGSLGRPFIIRGSSTTGGGVYMRAMVDDTSLHVRCWGCGTAAAALRMDWVVGALIDFRAEPNDLTTGILAWYGGGKPAVGLNANQRGVGEQTSYCTFLNCYTNACSIGKYLASTLGNNFFGGDSEYNTAQGLLTEANALNDRFYGSNFEVNSPDISIAGHFLELISCDSVTITIGPTAQSVKLEGGNTDAITIVAGANSTLISGVKYSRGVGGSVITNGDPSTRFRDNKNLTTGAMENEPKQVIVGTITASPITYTNNTGNEVWVYIAGGTPVANGYVVQQAGNNLICPYPSMVRVLPGNGVTYNFTVAPTTFFILKG